MTSAARLFHSSLIPGISRRRRIGLAIGPTTLYIAPIQGSPDRGKAFAPWAVRLQGNLLDPGSDAGETIRAALDACPYLTPNSSDSLHVVVMPPLALGRQIPLPRLTKGEYRQILSRDAVRYFATDRSPKVVGVISRAERRSSPVQIFAASTSASLVDAIEKTVTDFGCELASLDCAYASWTGAASSIWPSLARSNSAVIICQPEVTEIIFSHGARPDVVRRVSANAPAEKLLEALGMYSEQGPPRAVAILGSPERYHEWGSILSEAGVSVLPSTAASALDGGTLSAIYAAVGTGPGLYPERMYAASRSRSQQLARRLGITAATLVILSAALLLLGVKRELRIVGTERSAIRGEVSRALNVKSDISALEARAAMIASLSATTPRWSAVISSITEALPPDAYLTSFQARADTLVLEGVATRAAGVFEALQRDRELTAVHSTAPVRQQLQDGNPVEHFAVAARLATPRSTPRPGK